MTQDDSPYSAVEALRVAREQAADYDPLGKLLQLQRELLLMEQQYGLSSDEFYRRYQAGAMGDDVEIVGWAGRYRMFVELRSVITEGLNQVVVLPAQTLV